MRVGGKADKTCAQGVFCRMAKDVRLGFAKPGDSFGEEGAVKKQKKRLHPEKERMQPFLWYNVIVQKQNPQEHYTAYQLKLPVEIEKIIEISDPVYSFSEVMDHIDLNKYLTIEERRPGRPRYDQKTLLKIILFAFMENGYASVREIEKYCKTDI